MASNLVCGTFGDVPNLHIQVWWPLARHLAQGANRHVAVSPNPHRLLVQPPSSLWRPYLGWLNLIFPEFLACADLSGKILDITAQEHHSQAQVPMLAANVIKSAHRQCVWTIL